MIIESLLHLALEIEANPDRSTELIASFKSQDKETSDFLESISKVVVYVQPALIRTFKTSKDSHGISFIKFVDENAVGTLFQSVDDGETYLFTGRNADGELTGVKLGKTKQEIIYSKFVKRIF